MGTNDDPGNSDSVHNPGWNGTASNDPGWNGGNQVVYDKDVAFARARNFGKVRFTKNGVRFYGNVMFRIRRAYPFYCPEVVLRIANGGDIPAKISKIFILVKEFDEKDKLIAYGKLILPPRKWIWIKRPPLQGTALDDVRLAYYEMDIDCDGSVDYEGNTLVGLFTDLQSEYGRRIQLDPGDCFELTFALLFGQGPPSDPLPMGHEIIGTMVIKYTQWNLVP